MAKSILTPSCETLPANGGYTVHPVPTPTLLEKERSKRKKESGFNQNLNLFNRGNAISLAPIISGSSQLPKPPIRTGITKKKIIVRPGFFRIFFFLVSSMVFYHQT